MFKPSYDLTEFTEKVQLMKFWNELLFKLIIEYLLELSLASFKR